MPLYQASRTGMCTDSGEQKNVTLDHILAERRSYRMFRPEFPPEDAIRRIIHAGLLAPFAAAMVGNFTDYFPPVLCDEEGIAEHNCCRSDRHSRNPPDVRKPPRGYEKQPATSGTRDGVCPATRNDKKTRDCTRHWHSTHYIVVAERKGFPPVELQSLAHCMENMWLKATALELGFQLISITSEMAQNLNSVQFSGLPRANGC